MNLLSKCSTTKKSFPNLCQGEVAFPYYFLSRALFFVYATWVTIVHVWRVCVLTHIWRHEGKVQVLLLRLPLGKLKLPGASSGCLTGHPQPTAK